MLALYRVLGVVGAPAIRAYLWLRRRRGREDVLRFAERLGRPSRPRPTGPLVWVHAASIGESLSLLPLVERIVAERPGAHVLFTTGTVTSARLIADRLPPRAVHQYVPVDRRAYLRPFLDHWRPDLVLWAESEFWPNLLSEPARRGIPMVLVNGRVSPRSFAGWSRAPGLIRTILGGFALCLAQSEEDAERLRALGAAPVRCVGNLKYAVPALPADPAALAELESALAGRPRWLAASTHRGEEEAVAAVHRRLAARLPNLLTVIVPRHADRGDEIAVLLQGQGLRVARRSRGEAIHPTAEVYLADSFGELGLFYRLAPVVFMGKSLVDLGGQNPLEAARLGAAILYGPHMWNFPDVSRALLDAGAAEIVRDADGLAAAVARLLVDNDARTARIAAGTRVVTAQEGALDRVIEALAPFLDRLEAKAHAAA